MIITTLITIKLQAINNRNHILKQQLKFLLTKRASCLYIKKSVALYGLLIQTADKPNYGWVF